MKRKIRAKEIKFKNKIKLCNMHVVVVTVHGSRWFALAAMPSIVTMRCDGVCLCSIIMRKLKNPINKNHSVSFLRSLFWATDTNTHSLAFIRFTISYLRSQISFGVCHWRKSEDSSISSSRMSQNRHTFFISQTLTHIGRRSPAKKNTSTRESTKNEIKTKIFSALNHCAQKKKLNPQNLLHLFY